MKLKRITTDLLQIISKIIPGTLLKRQVHREIFGIFYHAVSDAPLDHVQHLYPIVPVAAFNDALETMYEHFTFVTYKQLQDHFEKKESLPPKALHLSFDDGFAECYHVVRPILLKKRIPCTFFLTLDWLDNRMLYFRHAISLCVAKMYSLKLEEQRHVIQELNQHLALSLKDHAGFVDWITAFREPSEKTLEEVENRLGLDIHAYLEKTKPYLTTTQVQEMHREGFTIGAHGLSHRKLGFIPKDEIKLEIVKSCNAVQSITGQQRVPFSFPQSAGNIDRHQLADIRSRNHQVGLLFDTKDLHQDVPFIINRLWAERPLTFERKLHPLTEILDHAYREAWVEGVVERWRGVF